MGTAELADRLRHLVADSELKLDQELDTQYILEGLMARVTEVADALDGRTSVTPVIRPVYELTPREDMGTLTVEV